MNAKVKKYFSIRELTCNHVASKYGDAAWQFVDQRLLDVLVWLREGLGKAIIVNNYNIGGAYSQRGLRCNCCQIVANKTISNQVYVSAHLQGQAADLTVKGMTAAEVRSWIQDHASTLPHPVRLEDDVTWVHVDMRNITNQKVVLFKA